MMKKNLNVDAMILDLRNVQEDFLDRYEQIKLDCMIALTIGMFMAIAGSSPFLYLTSGVLRLTALGMHSLEEYPGTNRYSLNVWDGSSK